MTDLVSKSSVLDIYAELYDVFDDNKAIQEELSKVYDKLRGLKEQEPVRPKAWVPKGQVMAKVRGYYCPVCDTSVVHGDRFCHWCGRGLTWD